MDELSSTIRRCQLQLKFDNNTEGYGNCFPNAIVQQCRRPEIRAWLQDNKPWAIVNHQQMLRKKVTNLSLTSRNKSICNLKDQYDEQYHTADNKSWTDYWIEMAKEGVWVNHLFVQVTAWYLGLDIQILTTSATPKCPFIYIYGDIKKPDESATGPSLLIGNYTNVHYQSLLPLIQESSKMRHEKPPEFEIARGEETTTQSNEQCDDFTYINGDSHIKFRQIESGKFLCPYCETTLSRLIIHIASKKCPIQKSNIDATEFKNQLNSFREGFRLEIGRKKSRKNLAKQREEMGNKLLKEKQNTKKQKSRAKLIYEKGPVRIKEEQNT